MLDAVPDHPQGENDDSGPPGSGLSDLGPVDCGRLPWHVVRFEPNAEGLVRPALHRLGVSTFLPLIRGEVRDRRLGKRIRTVPAFPGCLFAQWRHGFTWQRILAEPGVMGGPSGLLRPVGDPYGHPAAVPQAFMDELMDRARDGGVIEDASVPVPLEPIPQGQAVRITRGPFAGHTGLCGMSSAQRVAVLFEIMGCQRSVTARRRDVEAL